MKTSNIHPQAWHAIKAATIRRQCGPFPGRRYAEKNGVPASLYRLACQLSAVASA